MSRAIIVSGGSISDYSYYKNKIKEDDFIICADGGIKHLLKMGIYPHLWLGDFDSCKFSEIVSQNPKLKEVETISLNTKKNETDTHYACIKAIERGFKEIVIWAALGGRIDHAISNIHLLEFLNNNGAKGTIEDEKNTLHLCTGDITITKNRKYLSVLPISKSAIIKSTKGLLYPMENFSLSRDISMGVSNEIINKEASIVLSSGLVLVAESDD